MKGSKFKKWMQYYAVLKVNSSLKIWLGAVKESKFKLSYQKPSRGYAAASGHLS